MIQSWNGLKSAVKINEQELHVPTWINLTKDVEQQQRQVTEHMQFEAIYHFRNTKI